MVVIPAASALSGPTTSAVFGGDEPEPMCTGEPNVFPEDTNSVQGDRLDIPPELLLLPV